MSLYTLKKSLLYIGKHLIATAATSSMLYLEFCPTHLMCNRQARIILDNDGFTAEAQLLSNYSQQLDTGVSWPDNGIGSLHHFYNPHTYRGLPGGKPANYYLQLYWRRSQQFWYQHQYGKAMFFLGAATHFLQDVCEPHHSNCMVGLVHTQYEGWVKDHLSDFQISADGRYEQWLPSRWIEECAMASKPYLEAVLPSASPSSYPEPSRRLLTMTQRVTAGFWLYYLQTVHACEPITAINSYYAS